MASTDAPRGQGPTKTPARGHPVMQPTRGRGTLKAHQAIATPPPPSETSQKIEKKSVHWTNDQTNVLISWLTSHPANCHILFYENKGHCDSNDKPSTKDKTGIHDIITQHVFGHSQEWAEHYAKAPKKFGICGILPGDGAANAIELVCKEFLWYNDLFGIWNGIPNFTAKIMTSQPGKSHGANHLKIVATHRKATPPPDEDDGGDGMITENPQPASDVHIGLPKFSPEPKVRT
ncbi:hypothetical protein BDN67DRAFT_1017573 [Paxillus ammoniavirescens]|nr:hypothetical protein BDN67DRAFT_1017573 [Paxillus ammoniavirescens]